MATYTMFSASYAVNPTSTMAKRSAHSLDAATIYDIIHKANSTGAAYTHIEDGCSMRSTGIPISPMGNGYDNVGRSGCHRLPAYDPPMLSNTPV